MSESASYDLFELPDFVHGLSIARMSRFVALIALELTIHGRVAYDSASPDAADPVKLRYLNEAQHFLLGILNRCLSSEEVDISLFVKGLESLSKSARIGSEMSSSISRAVRLMKSTA